jgi:hypothetical protein
MKRISLTPRVDALARTVFGADTDLTNLAIYEATVANTLPLRKQGFYKGAKHSYTALSTLVNLSKGQSLPLILNHDMRQLAVGRIIDTQLYAGEVRGLFGLFIDQHSDLVSKLDKGVLGDVSLGAEPKSLTCSSCGWDYMGTEATFENIYNQRCGNDHTLGQNGVHLNIEDYSDFYELSLVNRGAVVGSNVHDAEKSSYKELQMSAKLSDGDFRKGLILQCEATEETTTAATVPLALNGGENALNLSAMMAPLHTALTESMTNLSSTTIQLAQTTANLTSMTAERDDLLVKLAAAPSADVATQLTAATSALFDLASKTQIALTGKATVTKEASIEDLVAAVNEGQAKLSAILPTGQVSNSGGSTSAPNVETGAAFQFNPTNSARR